MSSPVNTLTFKTNNAQQRVCQILILLAGHEAEGLTQTAVAKAVKASDNRVFHDLRNLAHAGLVERLDNGQWRLGPRLVQVAIAHQHGLARIKARVEEIEQRYSRTPV